MFNPAGVNTHNLADEEAKPIVPRTGYLENFGATLGLTVDQYLPFSSRQNVESTYGVDDFFGASRHSVRQDQIRSLVDDGTLPPDLIDRYSARVPRRGQRTKWNDLTKFVNENYSESVPHIMTDEEYNEGVKSELANRRKYTEEIQSRASGMGVVGQVAGSLNAMALDPVTAITMPLAAPIVGTARLSRAMYTASAFGRTALFEMGIQAPMELFIHDWNEQLDSEYTLLDSMINIGATGLFAGSIGGIAGNLGYKYSGKLGEFLSKDRDSLRTSFKKLGFDDDTADQLSEYQWEVNNSVDSPAVEAAKDIKQKVIDDPDVVLTADEKAVVRSAKEFEEAKVTLEKIEDAPKKKKAPRKKKGAKEIKFDETKTYYHTNKGGIEGGAFDNSRLPSVDPDAPFNAHWFSSEGDLVDDIGLGNVGKNHDTVTEVHLNLSKEASMKDISKIQKAWDGNEPITATQLREALKKAGFTHIEWDGRKPIDAVALEKTGKAKMKMNDGATLWIKKNDMGTYDISHPQDGVIMTDFDDLDEIIKTFPESNHIAMFDSEDIQIKKGADAPPEVPSTKKQVEDIEAKQEKLNTQGQEGGDVHEQVLDPDSNTDIIDDMYAEIDDDAIYYAADGSEHKLKDIAGEYDEVDDELGDIMGCILG